jgi:Helicase HerA, central domain
MTVLAREHIVFQVERFNSPLGSIIQPHTNSNFFERLQALLDNVWLTYPELRIEMVWHTNGLGHTGIRLFLIVQHIHLKLEVVNDVQAHFESWLPEFHFSRLSFSIESNVLVSVDDHAYRLQRIPKELQTTLTHQPIGFGLGVPETAIQSAKFAMTPPSEQNAPWLVGFERFSYHQHPLTFRVQLQPTVLKAHELEFLKSLECKSDLNAPNLSNELTNALYWATQLKFGAIICSAVVTSPVLIPGTLLNLFASLVWGSGTRLHYPVSFCAVPINEKSIATILKDDVHILDLEQDVLRSRVPVQLRRLVHLIGSQESARVLPLPEYLPTSLSFRSRKVEDSRPDRHGINKSLVLGINSTSRFAKTVSIGLNDLRRHALIVGQTGTGKTTLLEQLCIEGFKNDLGVVVFDVHGDMTQHLLEYIPSHRVDDVILIDPYDETHTIGFNPLENQNHQDAYQKVQAFVHAVKVLLTDKFGSSAYEWMGPRMEQHLQMNALLLALNKTGSGTILQLVRLFQEPGFYTRFQLPEGLNRYGIHSPRLASIARQEV